MSRFNVKTVGMKLLMCVICASSFALVGSGSIFDKDDGKGGSSFGSEPVINELFGVRLGERLSDKEEVASNDEGMLNSGFEPHLPTFQFETYIKTALPKTRTVVMVQGITAFGDKLQSAIQFYDLHAKKLKAKYSSAINIPGLPKKSDGEVSLRQLGVLGKSQNFLYLELAKLLPSEEYVVRMHLLDLQTVERLKNKISEASSVKFEGIFGVKFGERELDTTTKLPNGIRFAAFTPKSTFCGFTEYVKASLPKSKRICRVVAVRECENSMEAVAGYERVADLLSRKYGRKLVEMAGGESATKPDADGELVIKQGHIAFSGNRHLLLTYYKDTEDDSHNLRIIAEDSNLAEQLDKEIKDLRKAEDDGDLNAL